MVDIGTGVKIVEQDGSTIAILENAFGIGYEQNANQLWRAWFSMPANDEKVVYCTPLAYVEIWENGQRVELFRIIPTKITKDEITTIHYECEHVLATLIDDILFQYHEIGGSGVFTTAVINFILGKQTVTRWVLETNEFSRQFLYKWENENLLGSLFSIPNRFLEPYQWTYDTTVFPWKISLVEIDENTKSYIRYRKNLLGIEKTIDASHLCTRLYCLGYGEGVNQLDIKSVNSGLPYLQSATVGQYGIVSRIFVDRRFEDPQALKDRGQAILSEMQTPYTTYEIRAADISELTDDPVDSFEVGTYTQVFDEELNEQVKSLILTVSKDGIDHVPEVEIIIANKPLDVAQSISDLADRQRINEVYSQGATNLDSKDFADNCDANNPATIEFYIPEETVRINKMELNMRTEAFRAFSRAIQGGGAFTDTTASGGGSSQTSSSGGGTSTSTSSGGGTSTTSGSGGGTSTTSPDGNWETSTSNGNVFAALQGTEYSHGHFIPTHRHTISVPSHSHSISISNHSHGFSVPSHTHGVNIPSHSHGISIPNHVHNIEYGIFQGAPMPTQVALAIDGNAVPGTALNLNQINIIPYLAKDSSGRVLRGWHTITATPNNLARIVISMASQIFVQSRGGGDF